MEVKVIQNTLPSNRIPYDVNYWFSRQSPITINVKLKESTSIMSPTFMVKKNFLTYCKYNYLRLTIDSTNSIYRYYYITDVVSLTNEIIELHCELDALRSFNFRTANTLVTLNTTTNVVDWINNLDDTRWSPHRTEQWRYKQGHGDVNHDVIKGIRRINNIYTGFNAAESGRVDTDNDGVYLVKFWWGYEGQTVSDYIGIAYAMMNRENFRYFVSYVNNFVKNNPGAILAGISDFTSFIISAKYFPSLRLLNNSTVGLDGTAGGGAAAEAGYTHWTGGITVGSLCTVPNVDCYVRFDNAGYINNHLSELDDGDSGFPISPFGANSTENNSRLDFLCSPRWLSCTVTTPIGVTTLPMESLRNGQIIKVHSVIDLESGILTMRFIKVDSHEVITELKGCIYMDVNNQFTHIQSMGERILQNSASSIVPAATSAISSGGLGAAMGVGATLANSVFTGAAVNMHTSSYSNDLCNMMVNTDGTFSIKYFSVHFALYLNNESPVWDPHVWETGISDWNAQYLQTNYMNWCAEEGHGYLSNKHTDLVSATPVGPGYCYIRCADVEKVTVASGYINPNIENNIKQALLNGVTFFSSY